MALSSAHIGFSVNGLIAGLGGICDLSHEDVPNGSPSNAERNGKRTGGEQLGKPFETGNVNG